MTKQTSDYHGRKMMKTNQTTSLVVAAVLLQALSLPVMAEEIHGNETEYSVSLGSQSLENYLGQGSTAIGNTAIGFMAQRDNTTGGVIPQSADGLFPTTRLGRKTLRLGQPLFRKVNGIRIVLQ